MRGFLVLLSCAALFFGAASDLRAAEEANPIILSVNVEGNQRIEAETVRAYMVLKAGQRYSEAGANASLKSLFATGLFSDVLIRREGGVLYVRVEENAIVNLVAFEGNSALEDGDIESLILLRSRSVFSRRRIAQAVQTILQQYRRLGYYGVRIEPKIIELAQNRVNLVFEIEEGLRTNVSRIDILGNEAYSDSELRRTIATAVAAWWKILSSTDTYDPDRLQFDVQLLRRFYTRRGFADFAVISSSAELSRDKTGFLHNVFCGGGDSLPIWGDSF